MARARRLCHSESFRQLRSGRLRTAARLRWPRVAHGRKRCMGRWLTFMSNSLDSVRYESDQCRVDRLEIGRSEGTAREGVQAPGLGEREGHRSDHEVIT